MSTKVVQCAVGNVASQKQDGLFNWTVYVRPNNLDVVDKVVFHLHPTFSPNEIVAASEPFQATCSGWGTFNVGITVLDKTGARHIMSHELSFDPSGSEHLEVFNLPPPAPPPPLLPVSRVGQPMEGVSHVGMHGMKGDRSWAPPLVVVDCEEDARPGYQTMKATEFFDQNETLNAKVKLLAQLVRKSSHCCAYTGAGISTGAGIGDYASKSNSSLSKQTRLLDPMKAKPTLSHHVLAALHHAGHLKHWVQQNHDGLPQKAGFPPEHLNEIHGAWYDPSNPVVPMGGSLRGDLCNWMFEWEKKTDLTLAMGTSLCGMNADRMVETVAKKAQKGRALGAVIIALQQTRFDDISSLRIYARIDTVMDLLAKEMALDITPCEYAPSVPAELVLRKNVYKVPYTKEGERDAKNRTTEWDLSQHAKIMVTDGPGKGFTGVVLGTTADGHIRIQLPRMREGSDAHGTGAAIYLLGSWWLQTATRGTCARLPVVNY